MMSDWKKVSQYSKDVYEKRMAEWREGIEALGDKIKHSHHVARKNGKLRDFYRVVGDPLGAGSYGQVFKCCYIEALADRDEIYKQYQESCAQPGATPEDCEKAERILN